MFADPLVNLVLTASSDFRRPTQLFLLARYMGERRADITNINIAGRKEYFLAAHTLLDVGTAVSLGRYSLELRARNLLDERHSVPGSIEVDVPGEERRLTAGMRLSF
ncbi:hypothetical protein SCOR_14860 [Sulfidibacter corallicola]|uniref:TonB dependent receptor n=1 Tax=Sulfidibacter corallicola TaxID=2818388 RepID=A0A8A4TXP4_SULCO|nr:hypothetical protein [Sulfidibacter corallicola]QTD54253.1 hypothetical protein J3U87_17550 [Sulfidibacter corallicola]